MAYQWNPFTNKLDIVNINPPNPFDFHASTAITTTSSPITSSTFTTFSNSPTFTFTPAFSGTYKIYTCVVVLVDLDAAAITRIFLSGGTGILLQESQAGINVGAPVNSEASLWMQSTYTLTANSPATFVIQGLITSGTSVSIDGAAAEFYMFAERCG